MWHRRVVVAWGMLIAGFAAPGPVTGQEALDTAPFVAEGYPDEVQASLEARDRDLAAPALDVTEVPNYILRRQLNRWDPGGIIRVAFQGGNAALYAKIEDAASEWTKPGIANIRLRFKDASGTYLQWKTSDTKYVAEIRIAFTQKGRWSHVGRDSIDSNINGGAPGQTSLNLGSFDTRLPQDWRIAIIHEFGHALGFEHEHQNPTAGCDFRFDDDPGYLLTLDTRQVAIPDSQRRRPGLYTYLGHKPNDWPKSKVDSNLKALPNSSAYLIGTFDQDSIMNYPFEASYFVNGQRSPCYTNPLKLSPHDIEGARLTYPSDRTAVIASIRHQQQVLEQLGSSSNMSPTLRSRVSGQLEALKIRLQ